MLLFVSHLAHAEPHCAVTERPVAIVMSGGTSLGAYQAGALARALEHFQSQPKAYKIQLLAGASAGGINALLAYQDLCATEHKGWLQKFWTQKVTAGLFQSVPEQTSLLNAAAFGQINQDFFKDWSASHHACDLVLSIPLTLKDPVKLQMPGPTKSLTSNAQFLNFNLRMRPGRPARLENYINPFAASTSALLDLDKKPTEQALLKLATATSSIPLIFQPVPVSFCQLDKEDPTITHLRPPFRCPEDRIKTGEFIDGALLDTTPLAPSVKLLKKGLVRECQGATGSSRWLAIPRPEAEGELLPEILIVNLDVRNRDATATTAVDSVAGGVSQLLGNLLKSARDREWINLLENESQVREQILSLQSHFPRWSEEWNGFFGFFDADLRAFDFAVGYIDMEKTLKADSTSAKNTDALIQCLRQYLQNPQGRCADLTDSEQILFQTLLRETAPLDNTLPSVGPKPASRFFERMNQLSRRSFHFDELGLADTDAAMAPVRVRSLLSENSKNLTRAYSGDSGTTLNAVAGYLFGISDPLPVESQFHVAWGSSFEVGYSQLVALDYLEARYWRIPVIAEIFSPEGLSTANSEAAALSIYSGIELQKPVSSSLEYLVSLRMGYQISNRSADQLACQRGQLQNCEGFTFSPTAAAVFFNGLRLQAGVKLTMDAENSKNINTAGIFQGGLQF